MVAVDVHEDAAARPVHEDGERDAETAGESCLAAPLQLTGAGAGQLGAENAALLGLGRQR